MNEPSETGNPDNDTNKLYDLTMINAISENNPEFLDKLLLMFADTVSKDMQAVKVFAGEGNWKEAAQVAHRMKTSLTHFKVRPVRDIIMNLENYTISTPEQLNLWVIEMEDIIKNVLHGLAEEFPATFNQ